MRSAHLVLAAIFSNFFGWYIVNYYTKIVDLNVGSAFQPDTNYNKALIELITVFFTIILLHRLLPNRKHIHATQDTTNYHFPRAWMYLILSTTLFIFTIHNILTINFSLDNTLRGVGQFDRDASNAAQRFTLLLFPTFIFYRTAFAYDKFARLNSLFFAITVSLNSISLGDRRLMIYYLMIYILIHIRSTRLKEQQKKTNWKKHLLFGSILLAILTSYIIRAKDNFDSFQTLVGYTLLQGTLGALGISAILPEVKSIVTNQTGFLLGESFWTYLKTLLTPSVLLYALGGNEFNFRSSFEFNRIFNDNPNMGYDFMMIADFYWNFGYIGYAIYILLCLATLFMCAKAETSYSNIKFGLFAICIVFFIAGQRSDFGLFLKSAIYCGLFYCILYILAKKSPPPESQQATNNRHDRN